MNQDTFKIPGRETQCCGNCEYGSYDKMQGYVCVNGDKEYCADFVEYDHTCEDWEEKEDA